MSCTILSKFSGRPHFDIDICTPTPPLENIKIFTQICVFIKLLFEKTSSRKRKYRWIVFRSHHHKINWIYKTPDGQQLTSFQLVMSELSIMEPPAPIPSTIYKWKIGHLFRLRNVIYIGFQHSYLIKPRSFYYSFKNSISVFPPLEYVLWKVLITKTLCPSRFRKASLLQLKLLNCHFIHFNAFEFPKPLFYVNYQSFSVLES